MANRKNELLKLYVNNCFITGAKMNLVRVSVRIPL